MPELERGTFRLPKGLRQQLRLAATQSGRSTQALVTDALIRELARGKDDDKTAATAWGAQLAHQFLTCLPTPVVIKDSEARIVWCNLAYEDLFSRPRSQLLNAKVTDLGVFENRSSETIKRDIKRITGRNVGDAMEFWEQLLLPGRGGALTLFQTHRFVFRVPSTGIFIGDVSFDWHEIAPGNARPLPSDISHRVAISSVNETVLSLFEPMLSACPLVIAAKKPDKTLIWCNAEYEKLARKSLTGLTGKTAQEIFKLEALHPLIQNEHTVWTSKAWMYSVEELPPLLRSRTTLRFPIVAGGQAIALGTISPEFQQSDLNSIKPVVRKKYQR